MIKDNGTTKTLDWKTESGYEQRKFWMKRMREVIEELQFCSGAAEILQENGVCFVDLDNDDFPRISINQEPE